MNGDTAQLNVNSIRLGTAGEVIEIIKKTQWSRAPDKLIIQRFGAEFRSNQGENQNEKGELIGTLEYVTPSLSLREREEYKALFNARNPTPQQLIKLGFHNFKFI